MSTLYRITLVHLTADATALVEAANQAGGPDNISVIIVQFPG